MTLFPSRRRILKAIGPLLLTPRIANLAYADNAGKTDEVAGAALRLFNDKIRSPDYRHGPLKTLNDYFPLTVPSTLHEWESRRQRIREQLLVALGLWPMPEKIPLHPTIHGRIEREGYTIEKVFFASLPGHYVCGNLYRPAPEKPAAANTAGSKRPGVLFAHGHWANGRFHDAGEKAAQAAVAAGGEPDLERGRFFMQALPATLARLGFVVFHYDMVGYADSTAIAHTHGFRDAQAELRLQSFMGLQTWNSIRALDFLASLPDVDPQRVGMTGASGGGTQTFILAAIDDRLQAVFPAVMVSTAMQGGCVCENASHLRVGTGNVEIAALFAPKPQAFSAANDWTKEFMTKGFPQLQQIYALYGAKDKVAARVWLEYGHQYNVHARQMMYAWFVKHLQGREQTVQEPPFRPVPPKELSVFDSTHPRPKDERTAAQLRQYLTEQSDKQLADLIPTNSEQLDKFRQTLGTALRVMIHSELPIRVLERNVPGLELPRTMTRGRWQIELRLAGRTDEADAVPLAVCQDPQRVVPGRYVVWLHPQGKSSLIAVQQLQEALSQVLSAGFSVVAPDLFGTGDNTLTKPYAVNKDFAGYTYGYNRSLLAQQVHDALTTIGWCRQQQPQAVVHLVGWDHGGLIALLTKALAQRAVKRTAADLQQFRFADLTDVADPRMLPGTVKYGDVAGFACLCAPEPLLVHNHQWLANHRWPTQVYQVAGAARQWSCSSELLSPRDVVQWLLDQS